MPATLRWLITSEYFRGSAKLIADSLPPLLLKAVLSVEREEFRTSGIPDVTPGAERIIGRVVCDPPKLLLPYVAALEAHRSTTLLLSNSTVLDVIALDWTCGIQRVPPRAAFPSTATTLPLPTSLGSKHSI
jgi:hypothetical protein